MNVRVIQKPIGKVVIGKSVKRVEDPAIITGVTKYTSDVRIPNLHHVAILRSPYAHALIKSIDVGDALRLRGVIAVFTGNEVRNLSKPIYQWWIAKGMKTAEVYPLAIDRVRYVGEPVAAVVADSPYVCNDALELISVDYEPLKPIVTLEDAIQPKAPLLYEEWGNNVMLEHRLTGGDIVSAFKHADLVVEETISSHRYSAAPLETRCYVAYYEPPHLTLWASTQQPHQVRTILARTLNVPENLVRVIKMGIGGGFGAKQPTYHEEVLIPLLAIKLGLPLKFFEERRESLTSMHQAREQTHYVKVAVSRNGRILGIKDEIYANLGAFLPTCGPGSVIIAGKTLTGQYRIENLDVEIVGLTTNKPPYGAYRGYGKDAGNLVIERMMNLIARELGIDPIEIRKRNIIRAHEMPYRSATGALLDSGNYLECMNRVLGLIEYDSLKLQKDEFRKQNKLLGVGVALTIEPSASHYPNSYMLGYEGATIRIDPSGKATVMVASASFGTGHETLMSQIVAEELGLEVRDISVVDGDTAVVPFGYGTWGSRTSILSGNAVLLAARKLKEKLLKIASQILKVDASNLEAAGGSIYNKDEPEAKVTIKQIADMMYLMAPHPLPKTIEPGLEESSYFMPPNIESVDHPRGGRNTYAAYSNSAHAVAVAIDIETGKVDVLKYCVVTDCGRIINPMIVEGQVIGGVVQGLGGVLYEENIYDREGQPLATSFMDYMIPTALESPSVEVQTLESPSPFNPLGVKGVGEGPIEGVPAAMTNAVEDALSDYRVKITSLPITQEKIWRIMHQK